MTGPAISGERLRARAAMAGPARWRDAPAVPGGPQEHAAVLPARHLGPDAGTLRCAPAACTRTTLATLFLSVFLLLTGFFVLLVAMSEFDRDRARLVLDSLGQWFARPSALLGADENHPADLDPGTPEISAEDGRRDLQLGPPLTAEARRAGIVGRVELAPARLFDAGGAIPRARWLLLGRMAAATRASRGWKLEIAAPWSAGTNVTSLARRLQVVLRLLERLGADPAAVRYGLREGGPVLWSFVMRERVKGDLQ